MLVLPVLQCGEDWKLLAAVIDRLCLLVFLAVGLTFTLHLYMARPEYSPETTLIRN
jgi:hypothetical protein